MSKIKITDLDNPASKPKILIDPDVPEKKKELIPLGYIPIELSTLGKLDVPKVVHCRNFSTADLVELSMFNNDALPERLIEVLNSLILEKNVGIANWPDKIIIELLVKIYINFFTPVLPNTVFPWDDSDIAWLKEKGQLEKAEKLQAGTWGPILDFDLRKVHVDFLDEEVKSFITIKKRSPKDNIVIFEAKFLSYPRYGDIIILRKAIENKFVEEEKKFGRIRQLYNMRERYLNEGKDISNLDPISDGDYLKWQIYEAKRAKYATQAAEALYLVKYNEIDLSNAPIDTKINYISSPLFDIHLSRAVEEQFTKLKFGLNPEVEVKNPITGEVCKRQFTFQFVDILQAVQSSKSNEYDISYDN